MIVGLCNHDVIYNIIQQRLNDVYMQNIFSIVLQSSKGDLYQYIILQSYVEVEMHLTNKIPFLDVYGDINLVGHVIKSHKARRALWKI